MKNKFGEKYTEYYMNKLVEYDNYKMSIEEGKKKIRNNDFLQDLLN